ncbi:MAG: amino acid adenylation domain-containing protein [Pyrinomonadaceae bacterium]
MSTAETKRAGLSANRRALLGAMLGTGRAGADVIGRRASREACELSFAQQRLWFLDQLEPDSHFYNITRAVRVSGLLDASALRETLSSVVARHESLRTGFGLVEQEPRQFVADPAPLALPLIDLCGLPAEEREAEVRRLVLEHGRKPFRLADAPLLRACLVRLASDEHVLLLAMHHIVSDAWSMGILIREMAASYEAFSRGQEPTLQELPIQYADYAVWQRGRLQGEVLEGQLSYWRKQLADAPRMLELPTDRPRPAASSYRGAALRFSLSAELSEELRGLARREGVTLYMLLLAAWQTLLTRYTGQEDVVVGSPVAGRTRAETEGLIGFFVNTLVLRTDLSGDPTFRELLGRVREVCLGAYAHQEVPFEKVVEELAPERSLSSNPLFQVMFAMQNAPKEELRLGGLRLEQIETESGTSAFDLMLAAQETDGVLGGALQYSTDLFDAETAERMLRHFKTLLEGVASDSGRRLSLLPLLDETERRQVVSEWNETRFEYPRACAHQLFERQAEETPDALALVRGSERLTYAELNSRANQLARHLRRLGVGPESRVGVLLGRSTWMIAGLLGVLKAGGAYVPLDPEYPRERLGFMLEDAGVGVLLTEQTLAEGLGGHATTTVCVDAHRELIAAEPETNPAYAVEVEQAAYVIYTSGSTGNPKGVVVQHDSLVNYITAANRTYGLKAGDRLLQFASISFDTSAEDIYNCLLHGATLVLRDDAMLASAPVFLAACRELGVTVFNFPTAYWHQLTSSMTAEDWARNEQARLVIIGGERALPERIRQWQSLTGGRVRLVNAYGPTEATISSTHFDFKTLGDFSPPTREVLIGSPVGNTQVYVLDARTNPVPVGVPGELYIGGVGVARGYLNRPSLTAEKFVPDPFSTEPGARLYRTGDVVRRLSTGELGFVGRADNQVKVRGYRVELGEIEAALSSHESLKECVVLAREDAPGDVRLVAYVVAAAECEVSAAELREYLKGRLPEYMTPSAFVVLGELPLTPNGKVDRKALPAPDSSNAAADSYVAPRNAVEEVIAGVWAEVLRLERVGVRDNFFDLGGHSLLATQVVSRVRATLQVELPLRAIFEGPTVEALAALISSASGADSAQPPAVVRVERGGELPASYAQQRLWLIEQLEPGAAAYNVPSAISLSGKLDAAALVASLREIVRRHEALRTRFTSVDGLPAQVIEQGVELDVKTVDLTGLKDIESEERAKELAREEARRPFDLERAPLMRATLLRLSDEEHVLLLTMHHIVSDGWSTGVLVRELRALYEAYSAGRESTLQELHIQYADYAVWQRGWLEGGELDRQLSYWREMLGGAPEVLEVVGDRVRPSAPTYEGALESMSLPEELSGKLRELARREGVTLYMLLLAAWQTLLMRHTGQEDVVVGSPVAGRTRAETEGLIGFFVNTLVLRTDLSGDPTFRELLSRVREVCLGAYAHQDVPFEKVVEELAPERHLNRNPLFQITFALQNSSTETLELPGLSLSRLNVESGISKFPLGLFMSGGGQGLSASIQYSTDIYGREWVARMMGHFRTLLEGVCADASRRLSDYELSGEAERRLVTQWNDTRAELPGLCVHELFEHRAASDPEASAVVDGTDELTYGELNQRTNRLAHLLRRRGVCEESRVGLLMDRSAMAVASLLAVLKAGGAYVPLDPEYPQERLRFMIEDSDVRVVLAGAGLGSLLSECEGVEVVDLDDVAEELACESCEDLSCVTTPDSAAYVIYTSGSTGRPKGVLVEHRSITRLVQNTDYVHLSPGDCVAQLATVSFDASTFELWGALTSGARLAVIPKEVALSPEGLSRELRRLGVSTIFMTTALFNQLAREAGALEGVREVLFGGEAVDPRAVRSVLKGGGPERLLHVYGPTENTTFSTWELVREVEVGARTVSIGRPIANSTAYVLDAGMRPVVLGAPGELYVGGEGLARGYVRRAALTAERFVPHPFSAELGARLYKTGDVVRQRVDGGIEFVGRVDNQVKLRGYRIELGEVESALSTHAAVRGCAVLVREDEPGDKRLVAYVVTATDAPALSANELRAHMKGCLPGYMVPSAFVVLDELPLTLNGKVDRKALPAPDSSAASSADTYVAPRDAVEEALCEVWAEVLRVERVGVEDNFFELGGHSLLATQVVSRVRQLMGVELPLRALFEGPTVAALASHIAHAGGADSTQPPAITRAERGGELPASYAQQRLWLIEQLEPGSAAYNVPSAARLRGRLDTEALAGALREIVRRHESLRTRFTSVDGRPVQVIEQGVELEVPTVDLTGLEEGEREERAKELAREEARRPFDLSRAPLVRATLLRLSDEEHVLLLTMHHIVSDGWSMGVLVRELRSLYEAFAGGQRSPLAELPVQYADYAVWQRGWLEGGELDRQLSYWREMLGGAPEVLELPGDRPRPSVPSYRGASLSCLLPEGLSAELRELARREGVTLYMLLLAAWQTLLMRYTGQDDVVVGTDVANRNQRETEGLIGFFVNQLILRTDLSGDPTFRELLGRVREVCLGAYAHQDVPFEKLVEELHPARELSRSPLFQVAFTLQNAPKEELKLHGLQLDYLRLGNETAKLDMSLTMSDRGRELIAILEYSTELFDHSTGQRVLDCFRSLLESVAKGPGRKLSEVRLLAEADERQLLEVWNDTRREYPRDSLAHELFERQAELSPERVACVHGGRLLTYRELNERANRLARSLVTRGVGPDVLVSLLGRRGADLLTAMLAVFKAGGAYLPLDPQYPAARTAQVLRQSRSPFVLVAEEFESQLRQASEELAEEARPAPLVIERLLEERESCENLSARSTPGDLAYVIYTSGSTGQPKGAMVEHQGMLNHLCAKVNDLELTEGDVVAQTASQCFDISVWQFLSPLMVGGCVRVYDDEVAHDPWALLKHADGDRVTVLETVPSLLRAALEGGEESRAGGPRLDSLRWMVVTGEALPPELCRRWLAKYPRVTMVNAYGPTECSDDVTHHFISEAPAEETRTPIGKALMNTRLYVLDSHMSPVPVGVAGELYVGGDGVGRGYFRDPSRTAAVFIPDSFSGEPGARLYRTGDLARWLAGGELEFLGRIDHQVKVRGFRIELGEIEAVLSSHEAVRDCVVVAADDGHGAARVLAYLVVAEDGSARTQDWRGYVKERLPEYMVPSAFVTLDALPLTPNGKVDRKALPAPDLTQLDAAEQYVAARTPVEAALVEIWEEVLKVERPGIHQNFFDLGGHSLLAMMVVSRLREVHQLELPLRAIFKTPTVAELAGQVVDARGAQGVGVAGIVRLDAENEEQLLENLERLSDEQVELLLSGMLVEEGRA